MSGTFGDNPAAPESANAALGKREALVSVLRRAGGQPDEEIDVAEVALALAGLERPDADMRHYRHHLSLLRRDVADAAAGADGAAGDRLAILRRVLVERYGYTGDRETYDDLENANLIRVIDRRRGLPVALAILYHHAAQAQGWAIEGVNMPGHFLLRLSHQGERVIFDPFHDAATRTPADMRDLLKATYGDDAELEPKHYEAIGNRDILLRLQNNLKLRLLKDGRPAEAVEVIETMLMMAPGHAQLWREAGLFHARLENLRAAVIALDNYLELAGADTKRSEAERLLRELRGRLH